MLNEINIFDLNNSSINNTNKSVTLLSRGSGGSSGQGSRLLIGGSGFNPQHH